MSMSKAFTAVATAFRANTLSGETSRPVQYDASRGTMRAWEVNMHLSSKGSYVRAASWQGAAWLPSTMPNELPRPLATALFS